MDQSYESPVSASEFRPTTLSPHMSPQLNETICSCRCGCGCGCAGHGGSDDYDRVSEDESETAVESSDSGEDETFPPGQQRPDNGFCGDGPGHVNHGIFCPRALSYQGVLWLLGRSEGFQVSEPVVGWEQVPDRPPLCDGHEDITESMFNEASSTEAQSNTVSDHGSLRMLSPGPGIGALFISDGTWDDEVELVYYFDVSPLRLSAEY